MQENRPQSDPSSEQADRESRHDWRPILRRSDQATIACFIAIGLIGLIGWMVRIGIGSGEAVELDRAIQRRASFQIDINHAEWAEWTEVPGIGENIARRVIESRKTDGPFTCPEDLMRVKGLGPKTLEKIRPYLLSDPGMQNVAGAPHVGNGNSQTP